MPHRRIVSYETTIPLPGHFLDETQAQGEPDGGPDRISDDLRQETMALLVADGISFSCVCLPDERAGTEVVALYCQTYSSNLMKT